jgi:transcriptional regulator with XRE-family HTH domain
MTVGERLRNRLEKAGLSVREFHRRMDELGVSGSSYPNIHRYLADRADPPLEFLRQAAKLLGCRFPWLVAEQGLPTEEEERAEDRAFVQKATLSAMAGGEGTLRVGDIFRVVPNVPTIEELNRQVTEALGLPEEEHPTWGSALIEVGHQLGGTTRADLEASWDRIGKALYGPLAAFEVEPREMEEHNRLSAYILAMIPALLVVASERRRQAEGKEN